MFARHAAIPLCLGSYFLGVATSLLLTRFTSYSSTGKTVTTLLVVALGGASLATSLYLVRRREASQDMGASVEGGVSLGRETAPLPGMQLVVGTQSVQEHPIDRPGASETRTAQDFETRLFPSREPTWPVVASEGHDPESGSRNERQQSPPHKTSRPNRSERLPIEPQASDLIKVWDTYRREGDGHFNVQGLQRQLDALDFQATVSDDDRVGSRDCLLVVETESQKPGFFVLPSFAKSPRAVQRWFADQSDGALNRRIERVAEVAEGRWTPKGSEVAKIGLVA